MLAETAPFDGAGFYAVDFSGFIDSEDLVERVFHPFSLLSNSHQEKFQEAHFSSGIAVIP